jgi:zinc and cadmium transporter
MDTLILSIIAAGIVSLISLVGIATLAFKDRIIKTFLIFFVSFSAGGLMGGAFFHLIPEVLHECDDKFLLPFVYVIIGFSLFFILERILRWHHCHDPKCETHKHIGHINLVGDFIHNIIDGVIIFSAFSAGPALGIPVTLSIIFHEIPQEIGDFGVLLYAGFKKSKALLYNFLTALSALIGVVIGYLLFENIEDINGFLLPFAAGGFIYIAASDLIPELHKEVKLSRAVFSFIIFFSALVLMLGLKFLEF